ncbi:MAG: RNA polymerase sigma factor (sigma-70 family) [Planctomycetota bacterium]|jgi:RNA polymerase sigma factor (sigma-70 family)
MRFHTRESSQPEDNTPVHEDLALIVAALGGDDKAIEFLSDRVRIVPRVLASLNGRWGRPLTEHDIEDLSQDVVLFVLQKLEGYRGLSPFDAWLYRFCSLQLRNRVRREVFRRKVVTNEDAEMAFQVDPSDQLDGETMWSYVQEMDAGDREIMQAKHKRGLSFTEIGEELDTPPSSIKTRYYRSLEWLRLRLRQQDSSELKRKGEAS